MTEPTPTGFDRTPLAEPLEDEPHLFDRPENVQRLLRGFYLCCLLLVLADFVVRRHTSHPWERLPAFYALYGFASCVLLVLLAKQMRRGVMRDERYYEDA